MTGGKSGLRRTGWSITSTSREVRESAAESRPPNGQAEYSGTCLMRGKAETVR